MLNEPLLEPRRQRREEKVHVAKNSLVRSLARPDFRAPLAAPSREFVNSWSNFVGAGTTLLRFDGTSPLPRVVSLDLLPLLLSRALRDDLSPFHLEKSSRRRASWKWEAQYHRPLHPSLLLYPFSCSIQSPVSLPLHLSPSSSFARGTWTSRAPLHPPGL